MNAQFSGNVSRVFQTKINQIRKTENEENQGNVVGQLFIVSTHQNYESVGVQNYDLLLQKRNPHLAHGTNDHLHTVLVVDKLKNPKNTVNARHHIFFSENQKSAYYQTYKAK